MQYKKADPQLNTQYEKIFQEMLEKDALSDDRFFAAGITKTQAIDETTGYTPNLLYVGIYLGIVFLISSGAVLGLRLLSEANDEKEQYKIMGGVGAPKKMTKGSDF